MISKLTKQGFIYYVATSLIIAVQFFLYITKSSIASSMDSTGWLFYCTACLSHAMLVALIPFLMSMLVSVISKKETATSITHISLASFLNIIIYINSYVFAFFRFHINGIVLEMYFGDGSDDIFQFDVSLKIKVALIIAAFIAANIILYKIAKIIYSRKSKTFFVPVLMLFLITLIYSNFCHAWAAVIEKQSVLKSAAHIPYYYPLTATRMMKNMGIVSQDDLLKADFGHQTDFKYPKNTIYSQPTQKKTNVVILAIDSWNYRGLTEETMPSIYQFTQDNILYTNHLSCSNATRGSIFGMFFGVSSYYWADFEMTGTTPVLIDALQQNGYQMQTFTSATLTEPNFEKLIFRKVPIKPNTEGSTVYERDCRLTHDFEEFLDTVDTQKPFFAFLFYDLAHSFQFPKDLPKKFTPSWEFADYMQLNNDLDPTPFWNLYRNCLNAVDSLADMVINRMVEKNLMDDTYIIITGDHGQEFNENHKNYWGHGGNITYPQIHIPLIIHTPDHQKGVYTYRTTHYDISTTILQDILGVTNPVEDYSMGLNISDSTFRDWHVVGNKENFAFLVKDDNIIEKRKSGSLEISDSHLDPIDTFKVNAVELNNAIKKLNWFYNEE